MNIEKEIHAYRWRPKKDLFNKVVKEAKMQSLSINGFITEAVKDRLKNAKKKG